MKKILCLIMGHHHAKTLHRKGNLATYGNRCVRCGHWAKDKVQLIAEGKLTPSYGVLFVEEVE